jgi:hypothetical protein
LTNAGCGIYLDVDLRPSVDACREVESVDVRNEARRRLLDGISNELVQPGELPSVSDPRSGLALPVSFRWRPRERRERRNDLRT